MGALVCDYCDSTVDFLPNYYYFKGSWSVPLVEPCCPAQCCITCIIVIVYVNLSKMTLIWIWFDYHFFDPRAQIRIIIIIRFWKCSPCCGSQSHSDRDQFVVVQPREINLVFIDDCWTQLREWGDRYYRVCMLERCQCIMWGRLWSYEAGVSNEISLR